MISAATPETMRDGRRFLMQELARRCQANPRYSLRAFARTLGVTPAAISLVLSGKRRIGHKLGGKVVEKLGLTPEQAQEFLRGCAPSPRLPSLQAEEYSTLSMDRLAMVADWYHFA